MFNELNIMKIFFEEPNREFNVREAARILKIAPATASKKLIELTKTGFLKERKDRFFKFYKSNLESYSYLDLKVYYNIKKIKNSGLIESLNKFYLKPTLVLFGSASFGMDTETSDMDIFVLSEKLEKFPNLANFEKKINRKIQIFNFNNIHKIKNEHLINNILNGIILQGSLKWIMEKK